MTYQIGPWTISSSPEWLDITDTVKEDDPPFTLAKKDGVGALQFSSSTRASGKRPAPTSADLAEMVREFGETRCLGAMSDCGQTSESNRSVASASFHADGNLIRVWYVAALGHFLLVTYVCEWHERGGEANEAQSIVRGIWLTGSKTGRL